MPQLPQRKFPTCLMIDERTEVALRRAGKGNKSEGIRRIADEWLTQYHKESATAAEMDDLGSQYVDELD